MKTRSMGVRGKFSAFSSARTHVLKIFHRFFSKPAVGRRDDSQFCQMLTTSCKAARALECRCTHVRGRRSRTCVWSLARGKDVSCSDLNTIPRGRFFQDKPPISRFRFLSSPTGTHRLRSFLPATRT